MSDLASRGDQSLAEAVARHLWDRDHASHALGIVLEEVRPGYARASMRVTRQMLNSHDLLHGGMTFTLADTAFAYACNSYNQMAVATSCDIVFPASGKEGDMVTAVAVERLVAGRSGVYDVTVTNQTGQVIGLFRGQSRLVKGTLVAVGETAPL